MSLSRHKFFRAIFSWVADLKYFFQHDLPQRIRRTRMHARARTRSQMQDFEDWRNSADSRRKFAALERKRTKIIWTHNLKSMIWRLLYWLLAIITAPFRFIVWLAKGINRLRRMPLRTACSEIWYGYQGLIAAGLNRLEYLYWMWRQRALWLRVVTAIVAVAFFVALVSAPWIVHRLKMERSEAIFAEGQILMDQGRMVEAYAKLRTAALLNRNDLQLLDITMDVAKETRSPELVWWSELSAAAHGYDAESLALVVRNACHIGRVKIAAQYYMRLKQAFPQSDLVTESEVRLMMAQGRWADASRLARQAYKEGIDTPAVHTLVREQIWSDQSEGAGARLKAYLDANLDRKDEVGLELLQCALVYPEPLRRSDFNFRRLITYVEANPEATSADLALAYGRAYEQQQLSREDALDGVRSAFDWGDPTERDDAIDILGSFGFFELLDEFSEQSIQKDESLAALYAEGAVKGDASQKPSINEVNLMLQQLPLTPQDEVFWLAVVADKQGDAQAFNEHIQRALDYVENDAWREMNPVVMRSLSDDALTDFYAESFRRMPHSAPVVDAYLNRLYETRADEDLIKSLPQVNPEVLRNNPYAQMRAIYLKALFGADLPMCRYHAEQLVARHPTDANFYRLLAFVYAQSDYPMLARRMLARLPMPGNASSLPAYLRLCQAVARKNPKVAPVDEELLLKRELEVVRAIKSTTSTIPGA